MIREALIIGTVVVVGALSAALCGLFYEGIVALSDTRRRRKIMARGLWRTMREALTG